MNKNLEISSRIKSLRKSLGKSQQEFVSPLGITQSALSYIEKGGAASTETLRSIAKNYKVSMDWILDGAGDNPTHENMNTLVNEAKPVYSPPKQNITFIPLVAYGGFMDGYEDLMYQDNLEKFSFPGITGEHFAFEVSGDSMVPFVHHQETVIAKPEERIEWMVPGRAYVIVSVRGIHVKFFEKITKEGVVHFRSANKNAPKFPPMEQKEIKKIYQVVRVMDDPYKRGFFELSESK